MVCVCVYKQHISTLHMFMNLSLQLHSDQISYCYYTSVVFICESICQYFLARTARSKPISKQLRWIHAQINREGSPICGWNEKLVQRALGSLANDASMAAVVARMDLTIGASEPDVEKLVPHLRGHSLWLPGEPGVGKTPLGCIVAMML